MTNSQPTDRMTVIAKNLANESGLKRESLHNESYHR